MPRVTHATASGRPVPPGTAPSRGARPALAVRVRWWPMAAAVAVVEVAAGAGLLPVWPGLVHQVALPPVDLTTDAGVLLSRATSVPWFVVGAVAAVVGRATLLALMLGSLRRHWWAALRFYLVAAVPAYLAAQLFDAAQVSLYALLFWAGLVVVAAAVFVLAPVPWRGRGVAGGLAASARGARVPTVAIYLVALAALGGLVRLGGGAAVLVAVPVSGAMTVMAARALTWPGARPLPYRVGGVVVVAVVVLVTAVLPPGASPARPAAATQPGSLLIVPGIDTSSGHGTLFRLDPRTLGFSCGQTWYFSYRGPGHGASRGEAACPIRSGAAYTRSDTERPLPSLDAAFATQAAALPAPVTVVTHSSGAWVALSAVRPNQPVRSVVMLAPLADPLGYPARGQDGAGVVGADGSRLVTGIGRRVHFSTFRMDAPLAAMLLGHPASVAEILSRRPPAAVRALAVPAAYDLPLLVGEKSVFPAPTTACPTAAGHSGVVTDAATAGLVTSFLAGRSLPRCPPWRTWQGALAAGFRVPSSR